MKSMLLFVMSLLITVAVCEPASAQRGRTYRRSYTTYQPRYEYRYSPHTTGYRPATYVPSSSTSSSSGSTSSDDKSKRSALGWLCPLGLVVGVITLVVVTSRD